MSVAALQRSPALVLKLAVLPNLTEAALASVLLHVLLDIPYIFGIMGGFILSAVSPAVVVPSLIRLQDMGLGVAKGIPTLVLAAASFDDVLSISGFGVALGIGLSTGDSTAWVAARGPVELAAGAAYGCIAGIALGRYVLKCPAGGDVQGGVTPWMCAVTSLAVAAVGVLGGKAVGFSGGGAFAVIVFGLCLQLSWNKAELASRQPTAHSSVAGTEEGDAPAPSAEAAVETPPLDLEQGQTGGHQGEGSADLASAVDALAVERIKVWRGGVAAALKQVWGAAQPVLFASVGAAVDLGAVEGRFVGLAALVVVLALIARCCVTFGVLSCEVFLNARERVFVTLAWMPKATVQAAIGSLALDAARKQDAGDTAERAGLILLTLAVMSILMTAPVGALAIALSGPHLLNADNDGTHAAGDAVLVPHGTDDGGGDCNGTGCETATDAAQQDEGAAESAGSIELTTAQTDTSADYNS